MRPYFIILIVSLLFPVYISAQDETPEELFEDGDFFFVREEYEEAAYLYRQLLRIEPDNHNVHYKLGMAYLNIEGQEESAIDHFLKATENTSLRYRQNYYKQKEAPHHTWFYLGNAYRINNQLEEALEAYDIFKSAKDFEKRYNIRLTEDEIKAVGRAKIIQDAPLDIYKSCLEEPINTTENEYASRHCIFQFHSGPSIISSGWSNHLFFERSKRDNWRARYMDQHKNGRRLMVGPG